MSETMNKTVVQAERLEQMPDEKDIAQGAVAPKSAEEKALVRKIDLFLMPTIWLLYLLAVGLPGCRSWEHDD
jgi:hypothetical protein